MLDLDEPHRIVRVELLPPEQRPPVPELKLSIVDVKCTDAHGITYGEWDAYILAGIAIQNERGALAVAEQRGELRGLWQGVESLCRAPGIELTAEHRRELASLNATELAALLARLEERKIWT